MLDTVQIMVLGLIIVPLAGAVIVASLGARNGDAVRGVTLTCVFLSLFLTIGTVLPAMSKLQKRPLAGAATFVPEAAVRFDVLPLSDSTTRTPAAAVQFFIGIDGINIWLVALTSFLMLPAVLVSWKSVTSRVNEFYAWLLVLQCAMTGVFLSFDMILFYVFFELTLVPLFFLIGIWGGPMRREAARKFFLYTLAGSLITLLGMIGVVLACREKTGELTFSIPRLVELVQSRLLIDSIDERAYWRVVQYWVFLALTAGFAIKVPLVPLHTWLPLAHVEAPTAGSILLAGVLLKLGTYGFLRLALPLAPDAAVTIGVPLLGTLAAIGILYGAFCAFAQPDVKKLVAYSSVSHMGFCVLGLFALNSAGLTGGMLQMINHGLSTGGLFLLVGMLYERYHTRMIADYGGMAGRLKLLSVFMIFICLSSVGMPGLNGFVGEMLILFGVVDIQVPSVSGLVLGAVMVCGIFLGGWYLFTMLKNVFFGPLHEPHHDGEAIRDLNGRELAAVIPLVIVCIALGVWPQPMIDTMQSDMETVARITMKAKEQARAESALLAKN